MAQQIIMTEQEFDRQVETCKEYAEAVGSRYFKKKWNNEIQNASEGITNSERWARLLLTDIFSKAVGEWMKVEGSSVYVN